MSKKKNNTSKNIKVERLVGGYERISEDNGCKVTIRRGNLKKKVNLRG